METTEQQEFRPSPEKVKEMLGQIDSFLHTAQCHCGHQCIRQFQPEDVFRLRQIFVYGQHNSDLIDQHLKHYFHLTVNPRSDKGRYYLLQHTVCKEAFLKILGIDKERFEYCYKNFLEEEIFKDMAALHQT